MHADFRLKGWPHVHTRRLDPIAAAFTEPFKEGTHVLSTMPLAHPEHTFRFSIHDHRRIAVSLVNGEFIHQKQSDVASFRGFQFPLQVGLVDLRHRAPVQVVMLGDMLDGHDLAHLSHALGEPLRHACMRFQPIESFQFWPAVGTGHSGARDHQHRIHVEHGKVADLSFGPIVDLTYKPPATATYPWLITPSEKIDPRFCSRPFLASSESFHDSNLISFPSSQTGHKLFTRQRRPPLILISRQNQDARNPLLPTLLTQIREEP